MFKRLWTEGEKSATLDLNNLGTICQVDPGVNLVRVAQEPETGSSGTVETVFPGTERGTGTAGTVFQEPKPEPEPSSLLNCTETHKTPLV